MNLVKQEELRRQLFDAVEYGNVNQARKLIEAGADVNQANSQGWTPLHEAASCGHIEMVSLLLRKGAEVNKGDNEGITPVYCASMKGEEETVRLLIKKEAYVNRGDDEGRTPLHRIVLCGQERMARILVENGADVNKEDNEGKVPLYYAIKKGYRDIAKLIAGRIARLQAVGLYVSKKNLQLMAQVMSKDEIKMLMFCDNHKPLIDALPQLGYHGDYASNQIRTFLEENRDRFKVEFGNPKRSLIDFVDFEDVTTLHAPRLKLCAAVAEVVKNNTQLSSPSVEQHQAAAQARN